MKIRDLSILFLIFIGCKNVTEKNTDQLRIVGKSTELKIETAEIQIDNTIINSFLENPINLKSFKKSKSINYTTTGVSNGMEYHFHPKIKDSIFYNYNYPSKNLVDYKKINKFLVFKYGKNKHTYDDESEILIELKIFNNDKTLGKADLIGHTKAELETKFGTDYLLIDDRLV